MSIRAVLFDKDGTLIDVNATWIPIYREMLMDIFGTNVEGAEALMTQAGYDKASDKFRAGSILAAQRVSSSPSGGRALRARRWRKRRACSIMATPISCASASHP
jgi:phosphoglycolate phosphatase-like HAD superfamily hydrolase